MSWLAKLHETYEHGLTLDQSHLPIEERLLPVSHTLQNAHINIVIDGKGNFRRAEVLEKMQIVLPATEASAGRTSGAAPHPLADKIQYVAKDYPEHGGGKKSHFASYEKQLGQWCSSEFSHPKVCAVHAYVSKGQVVADLVNEGVLHCDASGLLLTAWPHEITADQPEPLIFKVLTKKEGSIEPGDALVCWTVEQEGEMESRTWQDQSLQQSWTAFDAAMSESAAGFCSVSGQETVLAKNHPAKLRHSGDKAKLISANDQDGFTFRGRFTESEQAACVSFEVTQKAHNALRWLIARQGHRNGDQVYVAWAVSGKTVPNPLHDSRALEEEMPTFAKEETTAAESQLDHGNDAGEAFARKFSNCLAGYGSRLELNEQIMVLGLDSATPGRMSVIYYRQLLASKLLQCLEDWHSAFAWPQRRLKDAGGKKKIVIWPVSSPAPELIAEAAYGDILKSSQKLKKSVLERILPCIVDGSPFPEDLMRCAVQRAASSRYSGEPWEWERTLGVACALFRGFHKRHPDESKRRNYTMGLEKDRTSRDYLYGRLLAAAEKIEETALWIAEEKRSTNAARLMQRFADRPYSTWRTLELNLQPYMQRLQTLRTGFIFKKKKELDEILCLFSPEDFISDDKLTGEFLLGYHCQRMHFRSGAEENEDNAEEKNHELAA